MVGSMLTACRRKIPAMASQQAHFNILSPGAVVIRCSMEHSDFAHHGREALVSHGGTMCPVVEPSGASLVRQLDKETGGNKSQEPGITMKYQLK